MMDSPTIFEYDEKTAARILGVAPRTLRAWRCEGKISYHRLPGGRIRYSMDQLVEFQRSCRVPVAADRSAA
jgi:predicted site-specific integrase-resolvase